MSREATLKAIGLFNLAYGSEFDDARLNFYVDMLADLHPITLSVACQGLIKKSKFLPSIAEIRTECEKLSAVVNNREKEIEYPEAWQMVMYAADKIGYDMGLNSLPPFVKKAADRIGWKEICLGDSADIPTRRAQFRNVYIILTEREKEDQRLFEAINSNEPMRIAMEKNRKNVEMLTSGLVNQLSMSKDEGDKNEGEEISSGAPVGTSTCESEPKSGVG